MYHFSRAIYRELAPYVLEERPSAQRESNRSIVLRECESAIERLMTDRRYFARPSRTLFNDVRPYFAIADLPRVYVAIDRHVQTALRFLAMVPDYAFDSQGVPRRCQAMTRKGQALPAPAPDGQRILPVAPAPDGVLRRPGARRAGGLAAARPPRGKNKGRRDRNPPPWSRCSLVAAATALIRFAARGSQD